MMLIESGVSCNVVDQSTWKMMKNQYVKCECKKATKEIYAFGSQMPLAVLLMFSAKVTLRQRGTEADFFVTEWNGNSLLGRKTAEQLGVFQEKLRQTIHGLKEEGQEHSDELTNLERNCDGLEKQLVNEKHEIDRMNSENDVAVRIAQLDKETEVARLMSEYKEQLKDVEIDNNSRIKQLVKDFQLKLAEKENEFQSNYMEAVGKYQDLLIKFMLKMHKQLNYLVCDIQLFWCCILLKCCSCINCEMFY